MIDITKDEFWETRNEEVIRTIGKRNSVKDIILKHKILSAVLIIFSVCIIANLVLIYSFFKMIRLL